MTHSLTSTSSLPDLNTCVEHIGSETLSAWRDQRLPTAENKHLVAHLATCPACQTRLALYEAIAQALQGQRELEPDERIVANVRIHARQAQQPANSEAPAAPHRRGRLLPFGDRTTLDAAGGRAPRRNSPAWRLMAVLAPVAAVLLLFVYVFAVFGPARSPHGAPGLAQRQPTGTTQPATAHTFAPSSQTMTPPQQGAIPSTFAPIISTAQAWHGQGETVASFSTALDATHVFLVGGVTPDGATLTGADVTLGSDGTISGPNSSAQAGMLTLATQQFTPIGITQPEPYLGCCTADGRFLFASDYNQPQETCGACHLQFWSYDTEKRTLQLVASGQHYHELLGGALDHERLVFNTNLGLFIANLAAGSVDPLSGVPSNAQTWFGGYSWPYLVYLYQQPNMPLVVHARNLATGADTPLPQLTSLCQGGGNIAISGDTLFCAVYFQDMQSNGSPSSGPGQTVLYELDHFLDPTAQMRAIAKYKGSLPMQTGADNRLVAFGQVVWDRAEHCFVTDDPNAPLHSASMALTGNFLAVATPQSANSAAQTVTIYDTTQLPTA
ncbi:MAG: hypothetical protein ABI068_14660 [Ktedonobacterales bacterium]